MSASPPEEDILAQVDALLGKRMGFTAARPVGLDDFPMLTDIVAPAAAMPDEPHGKLAVEPSPPAAATDGRAFDALLPESERLAEAIAASLERRLSDLFIRQQIHLEELIRRVVRDELARDAAQRAAGPPDKPV